MSKGKENNAKSAEELNRPCRNLHEATVAVIGAYREGGVPISSGDAVKKARELVVRNERGTVTAVRLNPITQEIAGMKEETQRLVQERDAARRAEAEKPVKLSTGEQLGSYDFLTGQIVGLCGGARHNGDPLPPAAKEMIARAVNASASTRFGKPSLSKEQVTKIVLAVNRQYPPQELHTSNFPMDRKIFEASVMLKLNEKRGAEPIDSDLLLNLLRGLDKQGYTNDDRDNLIEQYYRKKSLPGHTRPQEIEYASNGPFEAIANAGTVISAVGLLGIAASVGLWGLDNINKRELFDAINELKNYPVIITGMIPAFLGYAIRRIGKHNAVRILR